MTIKVHFAECKHLLFLLSISVLPFSIMAQTKYVSKNGTVTIAGTSSLHDWTETSKQASSTAIFVFEGDKLTIHDVSFTVPSKSLKSEHSSMDNNTYKALKADKHPNISYVAKTVVITRTDASNFSAKTTGSLTIAGSTNATDIASTVKINSDKTITVTGSKKIKMTDYKVDPPTAVFGTIKTGDEITISFNCKYVKQ